ncbi:MAG: cytochrome c-type biogenesis protein CcmH [Hyphomicrobiales bacterium]|nr:cytochrome c-type biogenesis protein CcmH [Hyphomicrobiales bacterium]MCY4033857.1 cytochrome c-type biogenesis protein CcmH [Hyphomicrobiales bacterium]MCY4039131.1 cytochrome c-type biogenesis protein CcmH [Hyphomicrobiales bacterium]
MKRLLVLFAAAVFAFADASMALQPDERLDDPALEARARALAAEMRCLVCQNQSIDDSSAPFARDVRLLLRSRLEAGDTDEEVRAFLVARFGEFILLKPTTQGVNLVLWLSPLLALAFASIVAWWYYRRWRAQG